MTEETAGDTRGGHSQPTVATSTTAVQPAKQHVPSSPKQRGRVSTSNSTTRRNAENSGSMSLSATNHPIRNTGSTAGSNSKPNNSGSARKRKTSVSGVKDSKAKAADVLTKAAEILSKIPCQETKLEPVKPIVAQDLDEDGEDDMGDAGKDANKSSGLKRIAKQVIDII